MNENGKKILLVVVIVVAVAILGYSATKFANQDKMIIQNTVTMPPGYKSEKEKALEEQKAGAPAPEKGEKDLGG